MHGYFCDLLGIKHFGGSTMRSDMNLKAIVLKAYYQGPGEQNIDFLGDER